MLATCRLAGSGVWHYWRPSMSDAKPSLAILIPCLDEEDGVALVVKKYADAFPEARILVVDNGSTDRTAERARAAGAEVVAEPRAGRLARSSRRSAFSRKTS